MKSIRVGVSLSRCATPTLGITRRFKCHNQQYFEPRKLCTVVDNGNALDEKQQNTTDEEDVASLWNKGLAASGSNETHSDDQLDPYWRFD